MFFLGAEDFSRVALVTLHIKVHDYALHGTSKISINNCKEEEYERFKTTGLVVDWLYQDDKRNQNDASKEEIIRFIESKYEI